MAVKYLQINIEWQKMPVILCNCSFCNDLIVTEVNTAFLFVNNYLTDKDLNVNLCDSCFSIVEDSLNKKG